MIHPFISPPLNAKVLTWHSLDTAGTEQFGSQQHPTTPLVLYYANPSSVAMRDLYMKTGQGFLLVFSITSASSLAELAGLRDEIIRIKDDETVPIVICGNKADLEDQRSVPRTKGFQISQRWGAPYYEASARTKSRWISSLPVFVYTYIPTYLWPSRNVLLLG